MSGASKSTVNLERDGPVLVITIDRPQARNAIDRATSEALAQAFDQLDADDGLQVGILRGAGSHFCAGMDLKAFLRGERIELPGRGLAGIIETPPSKPVIAAVEGYALAGGCEIALACDLIVAADSANFGLPEVRRGLIAGSGGLIRLPQRIPRQVAMAYALTGDHLPAVEAHRWGLVNELTPDGEALHAALQWAHRIAANAPLAVRLSKKLIGSAPAWAAEQTWAAQASMLAQVITSDDAREGALAFAQRRPPVWGGR